MAPSLGRTDMNATAEVPELWGSCRGEITVAADLTEPTGGAADWISDWEAEWDEFLAEPAGAADSDTGPTAHLESH